MTENEATILATTLFTRWRPSLVRYVLQASVSHDVAEDLVQDVFVVLYQALRSGKYLEHPTLERCLGTLVLLKIVEVLQEQQPGGLFGVVKLAGTASFFPKDVIYVFERLLEHWHPFISAARSRRGQSLRQRP